MRASAVSFVALAVVVTAITGWFAFSPAHAGTLGFWALAAGPSILLGALAAVWAQREELLREWLVPQWGDFTRGVVGAMVLFGIAWVFVRLVVPPGSERQIWLVSLYGQLGSRRELQARGPALAVTIAATALAEELLWRGAVTRLLAERVGSRWAWVWAAVLYAMAYAPTAWSLKVGDGLASLNPVLPVAALAAGLLWGGMARVFGRLAPGVLSHGLFDWAVVMMFPLWDMK